MLHSISVKLSKARIFGAQLFEGRLALNPGLNLTRVSFSCVQKYFLRQFSLLCLELPIINLYTKRIKTEMLFKLSNLSSNFALTLGYLNPAWTTRSRLSLGSPRDSCQVSCRDSRGFIRSLYQYIVNQPFPILIHFFHFFQVSYSEICRSLTQNSEWNKKGYEILSWTEASKQPPRSPLFLGYRKS